MGSVKVFWGFHYHNPLPCLGFSAHTFNNTLGSQTTTQMLSAPKQTYLWLRSILLTTSKLVVSIQKQ